MGPADVTDDEVPRDVEALARSVHAQISAFLLAVAEIATGDEPQFALSLLMLETSQLALAGGRLGALSDVRPVETFEDDPGPDPDLDGLRHGLNRLLGPVDAYVDVVDPVDPGRGTAVFRISDELAAVSADLLHGLAHYEAGRVIEALWWWQYSYLASWGSSLASAMRAVQSLVAHTRLDTDIHLVATGTMG
jgi:hypothetical protein